MAKTTLTKEKFIEILTQYKGQKTFSELAEILNKNYTTKDGRPFTATIIADRARDAGLVGFSKITNKPLTVKEIKKLSSKENIKLYNKGEISLDTFRQRAIDKASAARRTPEQKAIRAARQLKKYKQDIKTEEGRARIKANRVKAKAKEYILKGMDPPATTATEALWKDIVKTARENPGNGRFSIASGLKKSMDRANFFSDNIKIKDSVTGKTFTFGKDIGSKGNQLKNFINKNAGSFDVANFQEVVKPYQQKKFIDSIPNLRNSINSQLIPGYNPGQSQNAFTVQHNLGRQRNPLKVSLAFLDDNVREFKIKDAFERIYDSAKDPKTGTIKVTQKVKDAFKEYKSGISELDTVSSPLAATRGNRTFGQSLSLEEMLRKTKSQGTVLPKGVLKKVNNFESLLLDYAKTNKGNVCQLFLNKGGRIGFANGGAGCVAEVSEALKTNPEKLAQDISKTEGIASKVKSAATGFLGFLKGPGPKTFGIGAGVGAAVGLVKLFRNDDPSTYLSNEDQQKSMLVDMATQPVSVNIDRPAILDYQLPALGATIAGSTIAAAPSTIKASKSRALGIEKKRGTPGIAKTGLRVLGRGLGVAASPALLAPFAAGDIASQVAAGDSPMDIATDPLNYLYPAFADQTPKLTRGLNPTVRKIARLGLPRIALKGLSRAGIGGFAASAMIQGLGLLDE